MKRHESLVPLSKDHHQGLILSQMIKKGAPQYKGLPDTLEGKVEYTLRFYQEHLVDHFRKEEEILFNYIANLSTEIDLIADELKGQHKEITRLMGLLKKSTLEEDKVDLLDSLGKLMEFHIRKEERELFQMIQETLGETKLNHLKEKLN